jgi:hypothetical protein
MKMQSLATRLSMVVALVMSAARFVSAAELPSMRFALGMCCADAFGNNCNADDKCVVNEMCTHAPYTSCPGDNGNADAIVRGTSTTYPPAFTACDESAPYARLESSYDPKTRTYTVSDALLKWDTSSLGRSGLEVVSAVLIVVTDQQSCAADGMSPSVDGKAIVGEWYDWDEPTPGCDASDYGAGAGVPAIAAMPIRSTGCYQVIVFKLTNVAGINPTGTTYLRLHITPDSAPTGTNIFDFTAIEHTYYAPLLQVTYQAAGHPPTTASFTAQGVAR